MLRSQFDFELPSHLIARAPLARRGGSRLLEVGPATPAPIDRHFDDLPALLRPGDLLVLNDTRVVKARFNGAKASGGRVEVLVERVCDERRCLALLRASRAPRAGTAIVLDCGATLIVLGRANERFELELGLGSGPAEHANWWSLMERHGVLPIPPYLERVPDERDSERYQTVYARAPGAVAAPTAGLHFDAKMLQLLAQRGVNTAYLTLHVGAGTFRPVQTERIADHQMHAEWTEVPEAVCAAVEATRRAGGRVVAVGTTCVRALEGTARILAGAGAQVGTGSDANAGGRGASAEPGDGVRPIEPHRGEVNLFITPGFEFKVVDCMVTNFHLPGSTLLMLVSAFAGHERMLAAYRHAVDARYRFFSYGDACFLHRASGADGAPTGAGR